MWRIDIAPDGTGFSIASAYKHSIHDSWKNPRTICQILFVLVRVCAFEASPRYENPRHRFNVLWHGHVHQTSAKVLTLQCRGACCTASGSSLACCPDRNSCRLPRFRPGRSSCTPPLRSWNLTENGNRISTCDWRMITCRRNAFRKYRDLICFVIVLFAVILGNKTGVRMLSSNCKAENYSDARWLTKIFEHW